MSRSISEFWNQVDEIYGFFLDSTVSYYSYRAHIIVLQNKASTLTGKSISELDLAGMGYRQRARKDLLAQSLHETTQNELKSRLDKNGHNTLFLANLAVVAIFQYWEDRYRSMIASELGIPLNDLKSDLMGDIRQIRIAIVHHGGVGKSDIEKCKVLKWFKAGDSIRIDEDRLREIVLAIKNACTEWQARCPPPTCA